MPKIAVVLGTKAEVIKMAPLFYELARRKIAYSFLYTGQHNIASEIKEHKIKGPDFIFDREAKGRGRFSSKVSASVWSLRAFFWIRKTLKRIKPKIVLVHGDTMTTSAAALATKSFVKSPSLAHVEAGLRSGDLKEPFPEEISRRIADSLSDWFFCPTYHSAGNLLAEGKMRSRVIITGNTNIDIVSKFAKGKGKRGNFILAKIHRHENVSSKKRLERFIRIISDSPIKVKLILTENLERQLLKFNLALPLKVEKLRFLPQKKFISLLSSARAIITDAGGETEEAAFLETPCVQFREKSERQEAEISGAAIRSTDPRVVIGALNDIKKTGRFQKAPKKTDRNVFGTGDAAGKIADYINDNIL